MTRKDKLTLLFSPEDIQARVVETGRRIRSDYETSLAPGESLLMVGVLNGAFIFLADLVRALGDLPVEVDFVRLSSYQNGDVSSAEVRMTKDLEKDVRGRQVLIVEDIIDCGLTLAWLLDSLGRRGPASLRVAVAVDKPVRRARPVAADYVALVVEGDSFLVGYGLDYAERHRGLPAVYKVERN